MSEPISPAIADAAAINLLAMLVQTLVDKGVLSVSDVQGTLKRTIVLSKGFESEVANVLRPMFPGLPADTFKPG